MSERRQTGAFDRIKTPEQRVLERAAGPRLDDAAADDEGRAALFNATPGQVAERERQRARQEPAGRGGRRSRPASRHGGGGHPAGAAGSASRPLGEDQGSDGAGATARGGADERRGGGLGLRARCSRCGATSTLDASAVVRAALPLFLVAPWRRHPVFALCPACRYRAWLRVTPT
jgi:hypothetical protein